MNRLRLSAGVCTIAVILILSCTKSETAGGADRSPQVIPQTIGLGGSVWFAPDGQNVVAVRDFQVELRRGNDVVARTTTDVHGRYRFKQSAGSYRICWPQQAGWHDGCAPGQLNIENRAISVDDVFVSPTGLYVWGHVTFPGGAPAINRDPLFSVASYPTVSVKGGSSTKVNGWGDYVLTAVPTEAKTIAVQIEAASVQAPLAATAHGARVDITIPNHAPTGKDEVLQMQAGETLQLAARMTDADHDSLSYQWYAPTGKLNAAATSTAQWNAPVEPGRYRVDVVGKDGKGGFTRKTFTIGVGMTTPPGTSVGQVCLNPSTYFTCPPTNASAPVVLCNQFAFLNRFTSNNGDGATYYKNVDPNNRRKTLQEWWAVAGFDPKGGGGTRGSYTNDNDLGFGRDMHIIETKNGIFAYVTNYLNQCRLQDPQNAALAVKADPNDAVATVCMEYSSATYDDQHPGGTDRVVKFFVYGPDNLRAEAAALDPSGPAPIPNLCLNCHGGVGYDATPPKDTNIDLKARFLPFDLDTFAFDPSSSTPDYAAFHTLNNLVLKTFPSSSPVTEIVNLWYTSGSDKPDMTQRPNDWNGTPGRQKLYDYVVARSCRTCHVAFDQNGGAPTWATYAQFEQKRRIIKSDVITSGQMPHALITFMNFWSTNFYKDDKGQKALKCFIDSVDAQGKTDNARMEACLSPL